MIMTDDLIGNRHPVVNNRARNIAEGVLVFLAFLFFVPEILQAFHGLGFNPQDVNKNVFVVGILVAATIASILVAKALSTLNGAARVCCDAARAKFCGEC